MKTYNIYGNIELAGIEIQATNQEQAFDLFNDLYGHLGPHDISARLMTIPDNSNCEAYSSLTSLLNRDQIGTQLESRAGDLGGYQPLVR